jgi:hypothetical protein
LARRQEASVVKDRSAGWRPLTLVAVASLACPSLCLSGGAAPGTGTAGGGARGLKTLEETYADYLPDFINRDARRWEKKGEDEPLKLSYQGRFFNMAVVEEDSRVDALILAGRRKEAQGEYRDAWKVYQEVIETYPEVLYRIAEHGIFIPARTYCQRRILAFPPEEVGFYRRGTPSSGRGGGIRCWTCGRW